MNFKSCLSIYRIKNLYQLIMHLARSLRKSKKSLNSFCLLFFFFFPIWQEVQINSSISLFHRHHLHTVSYSSFACQPLWVQAVVCQTPCPEMRGFIQSWKYRGGLKTPGMLGLSAWHVAAAKGGHLRVQRRWRVELSGSGIIQNVWGLWIWKRNIFFFGPILLCSTHQITIWCWQSGHGAWVEKVVSSHSQQATLWILTRGPTRQINSDTVYLVARW